MLRTFNAFIKNESGATSIENGILFTLIGIALIAGASILGSNLSTSFSNASLVLTPSPQAPARPPVGTGGGGPGGIPTAAP
ncbi:MAG TPA: Flp family type IVb pilin, partial [Chromatiales bacterium]|nr:Flp family type IVb pilin [Chromatiales bacterium]